MSSRPRTAITGASYHALPMSMRCGYCTRRVAALKHIQYYNYSELVPWKNRMCSESNDVLCKKTCHIKSQPYLT